jgi:phosphoribosylformylglycinamidine cyclo-ligase
VIDYKAAGVNLEAADDAKKRLRKLVESTFTSGVRGAFGGFGGMFRVPEGDKPRLLVASADGVGTKVKIAIEAGRHDTIGQDLVNHCVNDILVQGARPLFFLDYVAFGRLDPIVAEQIVAGVAAGCRENGCALIGGETAEMPGVYTPPDYDLAGFIVGIVDEDRVLGAARVKAGDVLLGLASTGLHTNGYSLARRVVSDRLHLAVTDRFPGGNRTVADVLLAVHQSYLGALSPVLDRVHALAHITGGGLPGNVDRVLPPTLDARIVKGRWPVPRVFEVLAEAGGVGEEELYRAWNMGVGMVVITDPSSVETIAASVRRAGLDSWPLGEIVPGEGRVQLM